MEPFLILTRTLHYASLVALAGGLGFLVFIAGPAFRAAGGRDTEAAALRHVILRILWASLVLGIVSGALWLVLEARDMSGRPLGSVFARDIIATVLFRTQFGHDWLARAGLAVVLALALFGSGRRAALWLALFASAAMLAALAWAGHAGATPGTKGVVHVVSDLLHLLAAGAWLGALLPLALLFSRALAEPALLDSARRATRRFSLLGVSAVGTLLVTGIINTWILVGTIPGLLGTLYGQLLLLKIAAFATMVAVAAVNRQRLTPALLAAASPRTVLRQLRRNALGEAVLGLIVLAIVGVLGTLPPGEHTQPVWPFPFRLNLDVLQLTAGTLLDLAMIALGLGALALALLRRRGRRKNAAIGAALILGFGWPLLGPTVEKAYPTTYENSPVPYDAASITRGAALYAENCALCHGADGRGDGPVAASLPKKPSDLTAPHIFHHRSGDIFWWISHGKGGVMPGFDDRLRESQRWDLINFVHARAGAVQPQALKAQVTPVQAPQAPDFAFEHAGAQETLHEALKQPVLLVLYRLPQAQTRLDALAAAEAQLAKAGLRLLALPLDAAADPESIARLPDFAASTDARTSAAYALFEGGGDDGDCEFLIDRAGFIRARWKAGSAAQLPDAPELVAQLDRLARMPLAAQAAHVHAH